MVALVLVAAFAVGGYLAYGPLPPSDPTVRVTVVAGAITEEVRVDVDASVERALAEAGVEPHDGRLLSAKDGRVLEAHARRAIVTLDGLPASRSSLLASGVRIEVVDGKDEVEATETSVVDVAPAPMAEVLQHVQERGRPGRTERVVGVESGELVSERVLEAPVDPKQTEQKVVALTFDDGPTTNWTGPVLAILADKGVKATFCQVGTNVAAHPEISAEVLAQGHQLCNHTLDHDEELKGADQTRLDEKIGGGHDAFTDNGLPAPAYYRPPGGFLDDAITATARALGESTLYWKVDTEDWRRGAHPFEIIDKVLNQVDRGAIILMHDGGGSDRFATLQALGPIIDILKADGYTFTFPVIDQP